MLFATEGQRNYREEFFNSIELQVGAAIHREMVAGTASPVSLNSPAPLAGPANVNPTSPPLRVAVGDDGELNPMDFLS